MSQFVATESAPQSPAQPRDLLARLYREIGISAVAAALDILMTDESEKSDERRAPAVMQENIAA